ncbi:MAG: TMEM143 family protein [Chloroflexi bacterium]|nr:TMEM143 family protein [Chloroflexota bacterium]
MRETFIPCSRENLIDLCLQEGQLTGEMAVSFRKFAELLAAYYHFRFYQLEKRLKQNYAPFNPDAELLALLPLTTEKRLTMEKHVVKTLERILRRANYRVLDEATLRQALNQSSLIKLKTRVDFTDFEQMIFYHRGKFTETVQIKQWLWKTKITMDVFTRAVLLLKFKDAAYFSAKGVKLDKLNFTPGRMSVYLYKNIPQNDLELLFPNVQVGMNWLDRLLFFGPALGAGVSVLLKISSSLLLILGLLLFFLLGPEFAQQIGVGEAQARSVTPVLLALLSVSMALGGFAMHQYNGYKNKRLKFLKDVTDTLFFKNLGTNDTVFHTLIDAAEEEETKEAILIYYHLLTHPEKLTPTELDRHIEAWIYQKFALNIDFDMVQSTQRLQEMHAELIEPGATARQPLQLLTLDAHGYCQILPLDKARQVVDHLWDNADQFIGS